MDSDNYASFFPRTSQGLLTSRLDFFFSNSTKLKNIFFSLSSFFFHNMCFVVSSCREHLARRFLCYFLFTRLLCISSIFYLSRFTLLDFLSTSSQASLPFLFCRHRTTTTAEKVYLPLRSFLSQTCNDLHAEKYLLKYVKIIRNQIVFTIL